jgi:tRNA threonylcarbamoyl adenosine modification protein YjeE
MNNQLCEVIFLLEDISKAASEISQCILSRGLNPFIVGYEAEMGTGKTTLTRELLYHLGVDRHEPVMSPTFTYIHEYHTAKGLIGHLDLYRLEGKVDLEELIGRPVDAFIGLFIEWPENGGGTRHLDCNLLLSGHALPDERRRFTLKQVET